MASEDNEQVALQFFGIICGGAVLTALLSWAGTKADEVGIDAGTAASGVGAWFLSVLPYVIGIAVTAIALIVFFLVRRRRHRRREEVRGMIAAALGPVMPADWDARMIIVTRWRGLVPVHGRLMLSQTCRDDDPEWCDAVAATIRARIGAFTVEVTWPKPGTRFRAPRRIARWTADYSAPESDRARSGGEFDQAPVGRYLHPKNSLSPPKG